MDTSDRGRTQAAAPSLADVERCFATPFNELLFKAHSVHRERFDVNAVQLSTLMNIKSGGCPEDCAYCPQSVRYATGVPVTGLATVAEVRDRAQAARDAGASRFCMGAAWRAPKDRDIDRVAELIASVRELGMESCVTLGMLSQRQAQRLKAAGLEYYNHNLDTSPEYYGSIIGTREYADRLETLQHVRDAGIGVCCGGIVGMGESERDRARMLQILASLPVPPESVPINLLVRVAGTPLAAAAPIDAIDLVRTIAVTRILMPSSYVRLSAGRAGLTDAEQALCFFAGANSIFYGEQLLTTPNPDTHADVALFERLGLHATATVAASAAP